MGRWVVNWFMDGDFFLVWCFGVLGWVNKYGGLWGWDLELKDYIEFILFFMNDINVLWYYLLKILL